MTLKLYAIGLWGVTYEVNIHDKETARGLPADWLLVVWETAGVNVLKMSVTAL